VLQAMNAAPMPILVRGGRLRKDLWPVSRGNIKDQWGDTEGETLQQNDINALQEATPRIMMVDREGKS